MTAGSIASESDALRNILTWSADRPAWQRDALRRILTQGELEAADIDQLTAICRDSSLAFVPLEEEHLGAKRSGAPAAALKNIHDVQHVNALAERQSLTFIPKGVTIVYGDNGAGKSGYVRILKRACRARTAKGKPELILPNIYEEQSGPQRAELEYYAGAQVQKATWKSNEDGDSLLSEISVFDTRTASVHVEETNDLAYTPFPMKLLERLVVATQSVKAKLEADVSAIEAQTPKSISEPCCDPQTATGKLIAALSAKTTVDTVTALTDLSEEETTRLAELASDFAHDPHATARRLRAQRARLEGLRTKLEQLEATCSADRITKLSRAAADHSAKESAAELAAQDLSKSEPLNGVGSTAWRQLWEAARAYSTQEAYPESAYPRVEADAKCVLCQQDMKPEAAARLERFDAFVKDRTQQDAASARSLLIDLRSEIQVGVPSYSALLDDWRFLEDELQNAQLFRGVRTFTLQAKRRARDVLKSNADSAHSAPVLKDVGLDAVIVSLEDRAAALLAAEESDDRKKLRAELAELKDRQWLSGIKADVLAEIGRREQIASLNAALKDTRPNSITAKNTELSEALITERLRARFAKEVDHLQLAGLAIELTQATSSFGISRFKITLIQSASRNAGDILSEGEYRCVALAGFLAELATNYSGSGIIFDDPVSSLDHLHREAIAKRLAEEGRKRQVIVFTHDLPFLFMLRSACAQVDDPADKTEIALRHVQKKLNTPGYCRNEAPEKAQDAATRLASMRAHLANTRIQHERDPDGTDWLITSRGLIDSLRQTWEAAVEDAISPVLRTFASKVDTKGFAKLSAITQADADTMRKHYGQCSVLLHKISDAINPSAPTPQTIDGELDALDAWLKDVSDRQGKIRTA